jgi:hypothetical protein
MFLGKKEKKLDPGFGKNVQWKQLNTSSLS